jgi:hypothetical protein
MVRWQFPGISFDPRMRGTFAASCAFSVRMLDRADERRRRSEQQGQGRLELCFDRRRRAAEELRLHGAGRTDAGNTSVIVAEVSYDFSPLLNLSGGLPNPGFFKMSQTFYARPRKSLTVAKSD